LKKTYHKCISLGGDCGVGVALRELKYRDEAYPFDWIVSDIKFLHYFFETYRNTKKFPQILCDNNIKKKGQNKYRSYISNVQETLFYYHDEPYEILINVSDNSNLNEAIEKYQRRVERLLDICRLNNRRILFIRKSGKDTIKDILYLCDLIHQSFPELKFDILSFTQNDSTNQDKLLNNDQVITNIKLDPICFLVFDKIQQKWNHLDKKRNWIDIYNYLKQNVKII